MSYYLIHNINQTISDSKLPDNIFADLVKLKDYCCIYDFTRIIAEFVILFRLIYFHIKNFILLECILYYQEFSTPYGVPEFNNKVIACWKNSFIVEF